MRTLGGVAVGLAAMGLFMAVERRSDLPMVPGCLLTDRLYVVSILPALPSRLVWWGRCPGCRCMRGPIIGSRLCSEKDAAFELDHFSRDPQWVLEWMAVKAAAYHKEAEKWERRARKKVEKAEAARAV